MGENGGTVSSSYWDVEVSGQSSSAGGAGKTTCGDEAGGDIYRLGFC